MSTRETCKQLSILTGIKCYDWNVVDDENETVELFDKKDNVIGHTTVDVLDFAVKKAEGSFFISLTK